MPLIRNMEDLGAVIRRERLARRWTQARLADAVGVSRQWLVTVEKGKPGAEVERVLRVLAVLGVPVYAGVPVASVSSDAVDIDRIVADARRKP